MKGTAKVAAGGGATWAVLHVLFLGTAPVEPVGETAGIAGAADPLASGLPKLAEGEAAGGLTTWREAALWRTALSGTRGEVSGRVPAETVV